MNAEFVTSVKNLLPENEVTLLPSGYVRICTNVALFDGEIVDLFLGETELGDLILTDLGETDRWFINLGLSKALPCFKETYFQEIPDIHRALGCFYLEVPSLHQLGSCVQRLASVCEEYVRTYGSPKK